MFYLSRWKQFHTQFYYKLEPIETHHWKSIIKCVRIQQVFYASREQVFIPFERLYSRILSHERDGILEFLKPFIVRINSFRALKNFYPYLGFYTQCSSITNAWDHKCASTRIRYLKPVITLFFIHEYFQHCYLGETWSNKGCLVLLKSAFMHIDPLTLSKVFFYIHTHSFLLNRSQRRFMIGR